MLAVRHIGSEPRHVSVRKHHIKQRDLQQALGFCSRCSRNGRCPRSNLDAHASTCPCNGAADVLQGYVWGVSLLDLGNLEDGLGGDLPQACVTRSLAPLLQSCCLLDEMCDRRGLGGLQWHQQGSRQEGECCCTMQCSSGAGRPGREVAAVRKRSTMGLHVVAPCREAGSQGGSQQLTGDYSPARDACRVNAQGRLISKGVEAG